jgi:hypothetical protein
VKYLDKNNIKFKCHRGRIPYVSNGEEHSYYPDFYLIDSDEYIDVKNDYHWNLQKEKFDNIKKSNPALTIKILLKEDMIKMGINLKGRAVNE